MNRLFRERELTKSSWFFDSIYSNVSSNSKSKKRKISLGVENIDGDG
jgi:hypothetical protein